MLKNDLNFSNTIDTALKRFVQDKALEEFNYNETIDGINLKKILPTEKLLPNIFPDAPINSISFTDFLRESKLRINLLASQSNQLSREIDSSVENLWALADDAAREVKQLEADIQEAEILIAERFQKVHFNAFVRPSDMSAPEENRSIIDWKTNLPFLNDYKLEVFPEAGATLPIDRIIPVTIKNIQILDEYTDVGDTLYPLIKGNPLSLIRDREIFHYIIARKAYDESGRLYNRTESTCKLLIDLSMIQLVNRLTIKPASHNTIILKKLEYLNENNELTEINIEEIGLPGKLDIIFEPVRASKLYITLVQHAPLEETIVQTSDYRITSLNKLLKGMNWSVLLDESSTNFAARIFDFSMESLKLSFITYKQLGYFLSKPIEIQNAFAFQLRTSTEAINISSEQRAYNTEHFLPDGTVLHEAYIKAELSNSNKETELNITFPVPINKGGLIEQLPLLGGRSRVCFYPDIYYSATKYKVTSGLYFLEEVYLTLDEPHGLPLGEVFTDPIELWAGRANNEKNVISTSWGAHSETQLRLSVPGTSFSFFGEALTSNSIPRAWLIRQRDSIPFIVHCENDELSLGTDYTISLDQGVNWLSDLPNYRDYSLLRENRIAGHFFVNILKPDYSKYYWITYKHHFDQYLHPTKAVYLRNGVVSFIPRFRKLNGNLSTLLILRSNNRTPYITSLIQNYQLKIRESNES